VYIWALALSYLIFRLDNTSTFRPALLTSSVDGIGVATRFEADTSVLHERGFFVGDEVRSVNNDCRLGGVDPHVRLFALKVSSQYEIS
jgi:hypothetical protein